MFNRRGNTVQERIVEDIKFAKETKDATHRIVLAYKVVGAVDIAVEFGLITYAEWEIYISDIFKIL